MNTEHVGHCEGAVFAKVWSTFTVKFGLGDLLALVATVLGIPAAVVGIIVGVRSRYGGAQLLRLVSDGGLELQKRATGKVCPEFARLDHDDPDAGGAQPPFGVRLTTLRRRATRPKKLEPKQLIDFALIRLFDRSAIAVSGVVTITPTAPNLASALRTASVICATSVISSASASAVSG